ncbi:uncharacterized protein LOC121416576 [Lytechinus variegatus]|uniref:uncharacterized protein LOC121416576 n=1 Tax=Lytechinus variegatus TaxID=7654 RepID=UPI001BB292B2|nr:uncharacterized protein LOC121416576 [Lytechinus variegatus]
MLLYGFGAVACGIVAGYYKIEFSLGALYIVTALAGLATISKNLWTVVAFLILCALSTFGSVGACGYYINTLVSGSCHFNGCLDVFIPLCSLAGITFMALITSFAGLVYSCQGWFSVEARRRRTSVANREQPVVVTTEVEMG